MHPKGYTEKEVIDLFVLIGMDREEVIKTLRQEKGDLGLLLSQLDRFYHQAAMENHPDRGGSLEKMQAINAARDILKSLIFVPTIPNPPPIRLVINRWPSSTSTTMGSLFDWDFFKKGK